MPTSKTPLIQFKKRALVHFAVDTDEAHQLEADIRNTLSDALCKQLYRTAREAL